MHKSIKSIKWTSSEAIVHSTLPVLLPQLFKQAFHVVALPFGPLSYKECFLFDSGLVKWVLELLVKLIHWLDVLLLLAHL